MLADVAASENVWCTNEIFERFKVNSDKLTTLKFNFRLNSFCLKSL